MLNPDASVVEFPLVIDNTMRAQFRACPRKFYWSHMRHLSFRRTNIHLLAGKAFADSICAFRESYWGPYGATFSESRVRVNFPDTLNSCSGVF